MKGIRLRIGGFLDCGLGLARWTLIGMCSSCRAMSGGCLRLGVNQIWLYQRSRTAAGAR